MFRKHYLRAIEYAIIASSRSVGYILKLPDKMMAIVLMNSGKHLDHQTNSTHDLNKLFSDIQHKIPILDISPNELAELPATFEHFSGFTNVTLAEVIYEAGRQVKSLAVLLDLIAATKLLVPLLEGQNLQHADDAIQKKFERRLELMSSMGKPNAILSPKSVGDVIDRLKHELSGIPVILQDTLVERAAELTYHHLSKDRHSELKNTDELLP